jgi:hypothetical protein
VLLTELELRVRRTVELRRRDDADDERDEGEPERHPLGVLGSARHERHEERADERDEPENRQPRDAGHGRHQEITHSAPRMATTPASIVRA